MIMMMLHERTDGGFAIVPIHGNDMIAAFDSWERSRRFVISESGNRDAGVWRHVYQWAHGHCTSNHPCFVRVVEDLVPGDDIDHPLGPQDQFPPNTILYREAEDWDDDTWDDDE